MENRIIGHLDLDAFFAAVEERDSPRFRGLPIVIGADPKKGLGRGVVSTANYAARKYGIHSAMPISNAWRISQKAKASGSPEAVFLPVDMRKYAQVSEEIFSIVREFSPAVEQASIDEAYFDLGFANSFKRASIVAKEIKEKIKLKERITASVGIGPNKLIAKIAASEEKPDGLTVILPEDAEDFLDPMPVRAIPGVGPKTSAMLAEIGVRTVRDAKKLSLKKLESLLGKWGSELHRKLRGQDETPLVTEWEAKSIGEQETFDQDTDKFSIVMEKFNKLCQSIVKTLKTNGFSSYRTVAVTVRFADFETKTRAHTLKSAANDLKTLKQEVMRLAIPFFDFRENPRKKPIRLVGVRIEKLA